MTTIPMKRSDKCAGNKWNSVAPSDKKTRRTWYQDGHFSAQHENRPITTITSPQATCSQGNWSLLPSVVHRRGLWKLPHTRLHNYPRKTQTKVRHNRAAQAEVTTPYPGPRFPAATVAHCRINAWAAGTGEDRQREREICSWEKSTLRRKRKVQPQSSRLRVNSDHISCTTTPGAQRSKGGARKSQKFATKTTFTRNQITTNRKYTPSAQRGMRRCMRCCARREAAGCKCKSQSFTWRVNRAACSRSFPQQVSLRLIWDMIMSPDQCVK